MRTLAWLGFTAGAVFLALLFVLPYWRAAWILAASAGADLPAPPGTTAVLTDYRPADGGRHPTIVMAHSFNPDGERDPRLAASLQPIARSGIVLIVPRLASAVANQIDAADVQVIVRAFDAARELPFVAADHRGLGGYSWSAGYALLAAADPAIRDQVRLVLSVGGYGLARSMLEALTSHRVQTIDGASRSWTPDAWAETVARDELARRAALPPGQVEAELRTLSPIAHAAEVRAPVTLLHGLNDPVVPEEETLRLEAALRTHTEVRALETRLLHHVNLQDVRGSLSAEGMDAIWQMVDVMRWGLSRL